KPEWQLCGSGERQSPIDIREGIKVDLEPIQFDYHPSNFRIVDNGHTIQVNLGQGNTMSVMGRVYDLVQFHFHRPSEERVNGRGFDMVVHLVHKDLDGRLAVVAVLLERGKANALIQTLWNNLPLEKDADYSPDGVSIDLNQFLPENRSYYTYMGSLTTPPCSEGVLWMVMKQPQPIAAEQIAIFSRLYPMNARPIQSVRSRLIKESR
ncbi:MAG: carbonic anhydrase family protein, partial [Rhodocyclaceae bacterium]